MKAHDAVLHNRHYAKLKMCLDRGYRRSKAAPLDCLQGNALSPANKRPVVDQQSPAFRTSTEKTPGRTNNNRQIA